jgi:hypothetical protein
VEDLDDGEAGCGAIAENGINVDNGVENSDYVGKSADSIDGDRPNHCAGDVESRVLCFLGHVDNGVDTEEGEGRREKAKTETDTVVGPAAGVDECLPDCLVIGFVAGDEKGNHDDEKKHPAMSIKVALDAVLTTYTCKLPANDSHHGSSGLLRVQPSTATPLMATIINVECHLSGT